MMSYDEIRLFMLNFSTMSRMPTFCPSVSRFLGPRTQSPIKIIGDRRSNFDLLFVVFRQPRTCKCLRLSQRAYLVCVLHLLLSCDFSKIAANAW